MVLVTFFGEDFIFCFYVTSLKQFKTTK